MSVKAEGPKTTITWNSSITILGSQCYNYTDGHTRILTSFGPQPCEAEGIREQGGPAEVRLEPGRAAITAHGPAGVRSVTFPGAQPRLIDYKGGPPVTVIVAPTN
jgi:hypothetical protein